LRYKPSDNFFQGLLQLLDSPNANNDLINEGLMLRISYITRENVQN
jgi:hypothetical protein